MRTPNAKELAEGLTNLPIILINTHADPDHISGNSAFEEFYMSPAEEGNYRHNGGKAQGTKVNLWGNEVLLYKFPYAGFLCEIKD